MTTLVGEHRVSLTGPGVKDKPRLTYFSKVVDLQSGTNEYEILIP